MILAPTHELAQQIDDVLIGLGNYLNIKTQLLIGGKSVDIDRKELENDTPHVVVGTPGRMHEYDKTEIFKSG